MFDSKPTNLHLSTIRNIGDGIVSTSMEAAHMNYTVDDLVDDLEGYQSQLNETIVELNEYERQQREDENPTVFQDAVGAWEKMIKHQKAEFLQKVRGT